MRSGMPHPPAPIALHFFNRQPASLEQAVQCGWMTVPQRLSRLLPGGCLPPGEATQSATAAHRSTLLAPMCKGRYNSISGVSEGGTRGGGAGGWVQHHQWGQRGWNGGVAAVWLTLCMPVYGLCTAANTEFASRSLGEWVQRWGGGEGRVQQQQWGQWGCRPWSVPELPVGHLQACTSPTPATLHVVSL